MPNNTIRIGLVGAGANTTLRHIPGFKAIPNGYLIDEQGVVRYKKLRGFDIRRSKTLEVVEKWAAGLTLRSSTTASSAHSSPAPSLWSR